VSKAAKRERQRLNREARRQAEIAAARRQQRWRWTRVVALVAVPLVAVAVVLQVLRDDETAKASCRDVEPPPPKADTFPSPPTMELDLSKLYTAIVDTSCGRIEILLETAQSPTTANNFVFLARQGFYDNTTFHRAAKDFVVQGGDPAGDGSGGPGYSFTGEVPSEVIRYDVGSVAMAKGEADPAGTAGSQFFIVTSAASQPGQGLDTLNTPPYQYALLGRLADAESLTVAKMIEALAPKEEPRDGPPTKTVVIRKITIKETSSQPATQPPTTTGAPAVPPS
jgi:peptidyl-prolyl cis-trans isomerase B (cyclophilin B)